MGERILVHCCCGPCATSSVKRLIDEGWDVVLHYQNNNIYPEEENTKRYEELFKVARSYGVPVIKSDYDHEDWLKWIQGYEDEPELGKRCQLCYEYNLRAARKMADELGIEKITTTLTVSRFKKSSLIFEQGEKFEGYEPYDFKKKAGFENSIRISKEMGLYRQGYCGCEFSIRSAVPEEE
ncbi:MAG: epoxyqueuosine reductase QueH [Sphaerochaetaceae bacterium]|nr:epoxyqueuosine reductase QueH [Sphaerochaetaceae bacterium]